MRFVAFTHLFIHLFKIRKSLVFYFVLIYGEVIRTRLSLLTRTLAKTVINTRNLSYLRGPFTKQYLRVHATGLSKDGNAVMYIPQ